MKTIFKTNRMAVSTMTLRYLFVLGLLAVLTLVCFLILQREMKANESSAATINVSGYQRMLSQRIDLLALRLVNTQDRSERANSRKELLDVIQSMEASHQELIHGDPSSGLPGKLSPQVRAMYSDPPMLLDTQVRNYLAEATALAHALEAELRQDNPHLRYIATASMGLLGALDAVVKQRQKESEVNIARLAHLERWVFGTILLVLLLTGLLIFRPMVRRIQQEMGFMRLLQVVSTAANEASTIEEATQTCLDQVCALTGWPVGHVYLSAGDSTGELAPMAIWHLEDPERFETFRKVTEATRFAPGVGLPGRVVAAGEPAWITDVTKDPNFPRAQLAEDLGLKAGFAFPVLVGTEVAAVLEFFSVEAVEPDKPLLEVIVHVGTQLGRVIERKRVGEALRESEARTRAIIDAAVDGIITINERGIVESLNPAAVRIFGYAPAEVIGQNVKILMPEFYRKKHDDYLANYLRTGQAKIIGIGCEVVGRRKDGTTFPMDLAVSEVRLGERRIFTGTVRNITERKEVERLKDELVSIVSHELRTPLTSLRGFAELMLKRDFPPEKQREFLTIIHNESLRLTNLINDFLDLQRMEAGRQIYNFGSVGIVPLLREAVALFTREGGKHTLRLEVLDTLPPVRANVERIRQVLSNLLSNAVRFSPHGGEVTVGARQEGENVVVWVVDQGVGIPPDDLPKLFSKFFRVDNQETRDIGGTGLGLALVKEIVEAHKGRVWVESKLSKGSTFFFALPIAEQAPQVMSFPEAVTGGAADVLLVENDPAYARLLREHLEGTGLSVRTTGYAEQALELARLSPPRLVLVDIHLAGGMDGWDLVIALKSDPDLQFIHIIIITASGESNVRGLALAGADYLLKPILRKNLMQAIRRQLPSLPGKSVLVVDEDTDFRRLMVKFLVAEGIQVDEAADGREALARMAQRIPDLLLLDLLLPGMDGFEVLRQLRADKRAVNLPVLVVTGKDLLPSEKGHIKHRLASLVSKEEASLDYFARVVGKILG